MTEEHEPYRAMSPDERGPSAEEIIRRAVDGTPYVEPRTKPFFRAYPTERNPRLDAIETMLRDIHRALISHGTRLRALEGNHPQHGPVLRPEDV